ncbi:MAG: hypothetical protein ACLVJH_00905 [Faecalibacterium prausnitzii]
MARNRQNLNIIYISDRMRETLRPIASCALTAVVAPMGYGKTTAVRWFLAEQAKAGPWCCKPASTRITAPSSGKACRRPLPPPG